MYAAGSAVLEKCTPRELILMADGGADLAPVPLGLLAVNATGTAKFAATGQMQRCLTQPSWARSHGFDLLAV